MSGLADLQIRGSDPATRRSRRPRVALVVVLVALLALLAGAFVGGRAVLSTFHNGNPDRNALDWPGAGEGEVTVQVQPGDTAGQIGQTLHDQDVVRSVGAFRQAAALDAQSRTVQPGFYRLREHMSGAAALSLLLDPAARVRNPVTLPEGVTVAQAVTKIAGTTQIPLADLQQAVANPAALGLPDYAGGQAEGFLFPATYDVAPGSTATQVLAKMVERYDQAAQAVDLTAKAAAIGRTPYQVLVTASLIERETAYPADRAKVARVIYNRLDKGMPLQLDSTVNYLRAEKKSRLTLDDLKVESDYNTYDNKGLPPTPIDSPGQATLEAALNPAPGDWLYFVQVSKDGSSLFTSNYDEFINAKKKAQAEGVY